MLLTCENTAFGYDNKTIIKDISLTVEQGEYLCIVGENGAGKSTLVKGLLGLIKPMSGVIRYSDELKNGTIGYLPQQTDAQKDFPATVMEVVLSGCLKQKGLVTFYGKKEKEKARLNMEKLEITHLNKTCYRELSGGQQQRVLLARALCATDKLLVLDEPVSGLDPTGALELYAVLRELNLKDGIAIVMVSHDIQSAIPEAKHVLHINQNDMYYGATEDYKVSALGNKFFGGEA